jgi:hypothetical protein
MRGRNDVSNAAQQAAAPDRGPFVGPALKRLARRGLRPRRSRQTGARGQVSGMGLAGRKVELYKAAEMKQFFSRDAKSVTDAVDVILARVVAAIMRGQIAKCLKVSQSFHGVSP